LKPQLQPKATNLYEHIFQTMVPRLCVVAHPSNTPNIHIVISQYHSYSRNYHN